MAISKGTNSGFVTTSPTADPAGDNDIIDNVSRTILDTSPIGANKITEIGWWCDNATGAANFEVGLYLPDGVGGVAGTRLQVSDTNAKGTTSGWKKVTVNWTISSNTNYWIAVQLDNTTTATQTNYSLATGSYSGRADTTLNNPYGTASVITGAVFSIYALVELSPVNTTNFFQFF